MTKTRLFIETITGSSRLWPLAVFWAIAGATATVGLLPYAMALNPSSLERVPVPLPIFALAQFAKAFVVLMLLGWLGLRLGRALGLGSPIAHALVNRTPVPSTLRQTMAMAAIAGGVTGAALIGLDKAFQPFMPPATLPATAGIDLWKRFLASFYGGITEELICRLFLMTLLVWMCRKFTSQKDSAVPAWMFWTGIIGAALLFGLGHLPATATVWPLTPLVIARALLLNAIAGVTFGWIYWRRGLEHAMVAHFFADIVLHVIGGG